MSDASFSDQRGHATYVDHLHRASGTAVFCTYVLAVPLSVVPTCQQYCCLLYFYLRPSGNTVCFTGVPTLLLVIGKVMQGMTTTYTVPAVPLTVVPTCKQYCCLLYLYLRSSGNTVCFTGVPTLLLVFGEVVQRMTTT